MSASSLGDEEAISVEKELYEGCFARCAAVRMGRDYMLAVSGGERPHIGSTVMSAARPSLTGSGLGVTSSVISAMGHKDEAVARLFAERVAVARNCTAVCACGIHMDGLTAGQLALIEGKCAELLDELMERLG